MANSKERTRLLLDGRAKYIRYKDGPLLYGMCQKTFEQLAKESKATIKYGKLVLVDCAKVDHYLDLCREL